MSTPLWVQALKYAPMFLVGSVIGRLYADHHYLLAVVLSAVFIAGGISAFGFWIEDEDFTRPARRKSPTK